MTRRLLVYRDVVLPPSELGFMQRQYIGFSELQPLWVGRRVTPVGEQSGFDVLRLGGDGATGALRRLLFKEAGLVPSLADLRRLRPVAIHAQFGRGGAFALPIARGLGIPLAVTFHGGDANKDTHYRRFPPSLFARRLPALMAEARVFICVSESVKAKLIERGFPPEKLVVLPIGTTIPTERPAEIGSSILFVGRFVPKKGVGVLITALKRLQAEGREPAAIIVGDGPQADAMRREASDLQRVRFVGWQEPDAVAALMREAGLLVVPSVRAPGGDAEGLPSVAVEAMALGVPVLASDEAGLAGVVRPGETGALVPAREPLALATAIAALIDDLALRQRLGDAGAALVQRDFDARLQSARLEALLLGLR
jgi:colanic acid/amylovoran biosynthesis glycosyltransferase